MFRAIVLSLLFAAPEFAQAQPQPDFNSYILRAISETVAKRAGGGYDISQSFTQNLSYGIDIIKASKPPLTQCVATVSEVIVEAMNIYAKEKDKSIFEKIPQSSWSRGHLAGLRANIYMFKETGSRGTGHTLERFGIGKELTFDSLKAGDFVNFNRTGGSGHSVIFLGYVDRSGQILQSYSDSISGFRYFSAQGKNMADAGVGYRNAFFDGYCPAERSANGIPRDCTVIRSKNRVLMNSGRMHDPSVWNYDEAVSKIRSGVRSGFQSAYPGETRGFIDKLADLELNRELDPVQSVENYFDGITTD